MFSNEVKVEVVSDKENPNNNNKIVYIPWRLLSHRKNDFLKFSEENYDSNGSNEEDFMSARRKREGKFNVVKGS